MITIIKNKNIDIHSLLSEFFKLSVFILPMIFVFGCSDKQKRDISNGDIAASVYDSKLYYSDIVIDMPSDISDNERSDLINSYIEHWVRKTILAHNAKKDIKDFSKINNLVEDYEKSLIIEDFKRIYIKEHLDSTITPDDLKGFYEINKNQFILERSVVNLIYAKFNDKKHNLDKFYEKWKKRDFNYISKYCEANGDDYFYKKDKWYDLKDVKKKLPSFLLKNKDAYEVQINKKGFEYFLKVFESKHKNENIPLNMVKEKVEKLILQKRKSDIIDKYIEELYKKELAGNNIKVYQ